MKLNANQIELLKKARTLIFEASVSGNDSKAYICWNVWFAEEGRTDFPPMAVFIDCVMGASQDVIDIIEAIQEAMDGCSVMDTFLDRQIFDREVVNCAPYYAYSLGRLAWVDKMIETGEIL